MNARPVNRTEEFVLSVCRKSFLSLWCYNNPMAKAGKELCDILIICNPHVIIISVKEVLLKTSDNPAVEYDRWERKAVDASVRQLYGADRWLASASHVIRNDGTLELGLPPAAERKVHRIAVAFGGRGEVAIKACDLGKGFVHVMSEHSFQQILTELDTVTDLVDYLAAKEAYIAGGGSVIVEGSESNLLGWYLFNGRSFPGSADFMIVDDTIWQGLREKPEFKRRKEADRESYTWDKLIELLSDPNSKPIAETGPQLTDLELALRAMARESRLSRRLLGRGVREFLEQAKAGKLRSRVLIGPSGNIYVFAFFRAHEDPKFRIAELGNRCFLARHAVRQGDIIIGVGLSEFAPGVGSASDLIYLNLPDWSAADDEKAVRMKADLGFFADANIRHSQEDEYPA